MDPELPPNGAAPRRDAARVAVAGATLGQAAVASASAVRGTIDGSAPDRSARRGQPETVVAAVGHANGVGYLDGPPTADADSDGPRTANGHARNGASTGDGPAPARNGAPSVSTPSSGPAGASAPVWQLQPPMVAPGRRGPAIARPPLRLAAQPPTPGLVALAVAPAPADAIALAAPMAGESPAPLDAPSHRPPDTAEPAAAAAPTGRTVGIAALPPAELFAALGDALIEPAPQPPPHSTGPADVLVADTGPVAAAMATATATIAPAAGPAASGARKAARPDKAWNRAALDWIGIVAGALLVALVIKVVLIQAFVIPSGSMQPTLGIGERVLVFKPSYHLHDVHRGDVIVFDRPAQLRDGIDDSDLIKRVIGLAGETVEGHDGHVFINGRQLEEPWLPAGVLTGDFPPQTVPAGQLWVMGDNRGNSRDSRVFGFLDRSHVVGQAFVRWWPLSRLSGL